MNIRRGQLTPKILPAGQTPCMSQDIAKQNFKYKITKPKFGLSTYPNACPESMEEIQAAKPHPQSADKTSMYRGQKPKHEYQSPVLTLTKKTSNYAPIPSTIAVSLSQPGNLEQNGVTGKLQEASRSTVPSGWQQL